MPAAINNSHEFEDGDLDYVSNLNLLRDGLDSIIAEVNDASGASVDLAARLAVLVADIAALQSQITTNLGNAIDKTVGLTMALDANSFKITDLANATNGGDAVNLTTANALLLGGGTPGAIAITDLGVGTLVDQEIAYRNGSVIDGLASTAILNYVSSSINSNTSAAVNTRYFVDTTGGPVTVTLPASPSTGQRVGFVDAKSAFSVVNKLVVARNGNPIGTTYTGTPVAEDMDVTQYASFELEWKGTYWAIF